MPSLSRFNQDLFSVARIIIPDDPMAVFKYIIPPNNQIWELTAISFAVVADATAVADNPAIFWIPGPVTGGIVNYDQPIVRSATNYFFLYPRAITAYSTTGTITAVLPMPSMILYPGDAIQLYLINPGASADDITQLQFYTKIWYL
jgi:hypothetical protein